MYNVLTAWNWSYLFRTYFMLWAYSRELTNNIFVEATLGKLQYGQKKNSGHDRSVLSFWRLIKSKKIARQINLKCYYLYFLIMTSIIQMIFAQCKIYSNFSNYDFLLVAEFRIFAGLRIFFIPLKNRNIIRFQKS